MRLFPLIGFHIQLDLNKFMNTDLLTCDLIVAADYGNYLNLCTFPQTLIFFTSVEFYPLMVVYGCILGHLMAEYIQAFAE